MQVDPNRIVSRHGRGLPGGRPRAVTNYFVDTDGMDEREVARMNLGRLRELAQQLGYNSLFDVAVAEARSSSSERLRFIEAGGLEEFCGVFRSSLKRKRSLFNEENQRLGEDLCAISREVYVREWNQLIGDNAFMSKLELPTELSPEYFAELYARMKLRAPQLLALIDALLPDSDKENSEEPEVIDLTIDEDSPMNLNQTTESRKEQRVVMSLFVLANQASTKVNNLQGLLGSILHANKVPKKLITMLHQLGICTSYSHLLRRSRRVSDQADKVQSDNNDANANKPPTASNNVEPSEPKNNPVRNIVASTPQIPTSATTHNQGQQPVTTTIPESHTTPVVNSGFNLGPIRTQESTFPFIRRPIIPLRTHLEGTRQVPLPKSGDAPLASLPPPCLSNLNRAPNDFGTTVVSPNAAPTSLAPDRPATPAIALPNLYTSTLTTFPYGAHSQFGRSTV